MKKFELTSETKINIFGSADLMEEHFKNQEEDCNERI